jgi:hypothetical protein
MSNTYSLTHFCFLFPSPHNFITASHLDFIFKIFFALYFSFQLKAKLAGQNNLFFGHPLNLDAFIINHVPEEFGQ